MDWRQISSPLPWTLLPPPPPTQPPLLLSVPSPKPLDPCRPKPLPRRPLPSPNCSSDRPDAGSADAGRGRTLRNYSRMLQGCTSKGSIIHGKCVHARLLRTGVEPDAHLWDCLVNMYSKCGSLEAGRLVLDGMPQRDVIGWTALMAGYASAGDGEEGVRLFSEMRKEGICPTNFAVATGLKSCSICRHLDLGQQLHAEAVKKQFLSDSFIGSSLIDLYCKCDEIKLAEQVFHRLPEQNVVCWNALLSGYARMGEHRRVLQLFEHLMKSGMIVSDFTLPTVIKSCGGLDDVRLGRALHCLVIKMGLEQDGYLNSSLLSLYSKCGSTVEAHSIFARFTDPDVVVFSAMISCFEQQEMGLEAVKLFRTMRWMGVRPNQYTLVSVANVAFTFGNPGFIGTLHAYIIKCGYDTRKEVGNAIIDMYMKSGAVQDGVMVFDAMTDPDIVSWNSLLSAFHSGSSCNQGLHIFRDIISQNLLPNEYTYIRILRSCSSLGDASYGAQVHAHILKNSLEGDSYIGRALLDMYANSGFLENASCILERLAERDVFAWTVIITAYFNVNQEEKAITCYKQMQREGVHPNELTIASCVGACSSLAALKTGCQLHSVVIKSGLNGVFVSTALVDMYANCGCLMDAEAEFVGSKIRDEISWNTIINGYSQHGYGEKAIRAFQKMVDEGNKPDEVTFLGVLSACNHAGMISEARQYLDLMRNVFGIFPTVKHYACMIDILGKAGKFHEVEQIINGMTMPPDASIWRTVLQSCRMHGNVEFGEHAAKKLLEIDPNMDSTYILLSNMYADLGRWNDASTIRKKMLSCGIKKEPGCSWIEINGQFHLFLAQDVS